eukprot:g53604.t1
MRRNGAFHEGWIRSGLIIFYFIGFGIAFGKDFHGFIGISSFCIGLHCCTRLPIVSGAVAERAYFMFSAFMSAWIYPVLTETDPLRFYRHVQRLTRGCPKQTDCAIYNAAKLWRGFFISYDMYKYKDKDLGVIIHIICSVILGLLLACSLHRQWMFWQQRRSLAVSLRGKLLLTRSYTIAMTLAAVVILALQYWATTEDMCKVISKTASFFYTSAFAGLYAFFSVRLSMARSLHSTSVERPNYCVAIIHTAINAVILGLQLFAFVFIYTSKGILVPHEDRVACVHDVNLITGAIFMVIDFVAGFTLLGLFLFLLYKLPEWASQHSRHVTRRSMKAALISHSATFTSLIVAICSNFSTQIGFYMGIVGPINMTINCLAVWYCYGALTMRPDRPDVRVATRPNVEVVDLDIELKENDLKGHEEDCDSRHSNAKHSDMATTLEAGPAALAIATVVEAGPADLPVLRGPEHILGQLEGKTGHEISGQVEGKTGQERGRVEGKTGHEAAITVHQAPQTSTTQRRRVSSRSPPAANRKRQNWGWLVKVHVWGLTRVSERQESVMPSSSEGAREQSQASSLPVVECRQEEEEDACVDSNHSRDRNITLGRSVFAVRQSRSVDLIEVLTEKSEVEGQVDGKHYKKKAEAIIVEAVKDEDRLTRVLRASEMKVRPGSATDGRGKKGRRGRKELILHLGEYPSDSASNSRSRSNSRSSITGKKRVRPAHPPPRPLTLTPEPTLTRAEAASSSSMNGRRPAHPPPGPPTPTPEQTLTRAEASSSSSMNRRRPAHPPPRPLTLTPEPTLTRAEAASSSSMNGRRPAHSPPGPPTPTPEQTLTRAEAASSSSMNRRRPAHPPPRPLTLTPEPTLTRAEAASSSSMNGRRPAHPPPGPPTPTPEQTLTRAEAASSSSMNRRRPAHPPPRPPTPLPEQTMTRAEAASSSSMNGLRTLRERRSTALA